MLVRVQAPHFCAGMIVEGGVVTEAAPILRWAIGKAQPYLSGYFKRKGWKASSINYLSSTTNAPKAVTPDRPPIGLP